MTSAPSQASASVHEVPASNWVRSRTFTSSSAVFCGTLWFLRLAGTAGCEHMADYLRGAARRANSSMGLRSSLPPGIPRLAGCAGGQTVDCEALGPYLPVSAD